MLIFEKKRLMLLSIFMFFLIIPTVLAYHRYYHFYDTTSSFDIVGFYENNFQFIDFILYLILIGGASKVVFQRRFGASSGGAGLLTIGLSGLISGALVWWEAQRGESVIMIIGNVAGSWFLWILGILFVLALYTVLKTFYGTWKSIVIISALAIIAFIGLGSEIPGFPEISPDLVGLITALILVIGVFFLFRWIGRRVTTHIATPITPGMSREEREILRQQAERTRAETSLLEARRRVLEQEMGTGQVPSDEERRRLKGTGQVPSDEGRRRINEILKREEFLKSRFINEVSGLKRAQELQKFKALPAPNIFTGSRLTDPAQRNAFLIRAKDQNIKKYGRGEGMSRYIEFYKRFQREAKRYNP